MSGEFGAVVGRRGRAVVRIVAGTVDGVRTVLLVERARGREEVRRGAVRVIHLGLIAVAAGCR